MVTAVKATNWKDVVDEVNKVNVFTERVKKRKEEFLTAKRHICAKRSRLATEASKENEGLPVVLRRAKIFQKIMEGNDIAIRDDELIVGSQTKYIVGEPAPTDLVSNITAEVVAAEKPTTVSEVTFSTLTEEDRKSLREDADYWKGRATKDVVEKLTFETLGERASEFRDYMEAGIYAWCVERPRSNQNINYEKVITQGFNSIIKEIRKQIESLDFSAEGTYESYAFLSAGLICCQAVITFAGRYAKLAREMAKKEGNEVRKRELEKIAEHCEWVPANPARNFHEALQSLWFTHLAFNLECAEYGETLGRVDQFMYPFYEKDIREGRMTRQEAAELLGCLWVKLNEMDCIRSLFWQKLVMSSQNQHVTVCGITPDGRDATNELSFLILEVARQMKMPQSAIYVRWHKDLSDEILIKAAETNRDHGGGVPAFLNDEKTIFKLVSHGVPLTDARDWCAMGCVGPQPSHTNALFLATSLPFNKPKLLELALNNGIDPRTGKQLGPKTGDPRNFKSYDELYNAFLKQVEFALGKALEFGRVASQVVDVFSHFPFCSTLMDGCIENAKGIYQGGARYFFGRNLVLDSGAQNIADSLAAMKKLVFEEKKLTMAEILDALAVNFEGKEDLRQTLMSAPCYGNDDDYVDDIFNAISWDTGVMVINHRDSMGLPVGLLRGGATQHYWESQFVGALPDGRKADEPLADGILSPTQGKDVKGPTAVMISATKMNHLEHAEHSLHNMKIMPAAVRTREGIMKFLSLIKTYFDRGGWHLQFNMLDQETLIEAQKHPEKYRDLVVRVAGYSAFFVDLSKGVQDDIIARTAQQV